MEGGKQGEERSSRERIVMIDSDSPHQPQFGSREWGQKLGRRTEVELGWDRGRERVVFCHLSLFLTTQIYFNRHYIK